ncbi:MAG: SPOR domain-containing protein [Balneolaceae bacterium]|nr:MAG: SPOR domain-containing protein [Balneolaceae bacterium]
MKTSIIYILTIMLAISFLHGCGPSDEELREQEQARQQAVQDSLQLVYEQQMAEMRQDSIEQARLAEIAEEEARARIEYVADGPYTLQIESWRSKDKAEARVQQWKEMGFENTYVREFGSEDTGDLWYRVRIGRFATSEHANNLKEKLSEEYETDSWVSRVG